MLLWNSLRGSQKRDARAFQGVHIRNRCNVNSAKNRLEDALFSPTIASHPRQHQRRQMLPFSGKSQKGKFGEKKKNFDSRVYRKHALQGAIFVPGVRAHGEVHLGLQSSVGDLEQSCHTLKSLRWLTPWPASSTIGHRPHSHQFVTVPSGSAWGWKRKGEHTAWLLSCMGLFSTADTAMQDPDLCLATL